jgi:hypothetical protein
MHNGATLMLFKFRFWKLAWGVSGTFRFATSTATTLLTILAFSFKPAICLIKQYSLCPKGASMVDPTHAHHARMFNKTLEELNYE